MLMYSRGAEPAEVTGGAHAVIQLECRGGMVSSSSTNCVFLWVVGGCGVLMQLEVLEGGSGAGAGQRELLRRAVE